MKFCSNCGSPVEFRIPDGDHLPRFVCPNCHTIHYQNPRIIAGCIPVRGDQVLLCKRAIEPRLGYWTFPAGFMENGEAVLRIVDDGRGGAIVPGNGLSGMRERIEALRGRLRITPGDGRGTHVEVRVPLAANDASAAAPDAD